MQVKYLAIIAAASMLNVAVMSSGYSYPKPQLLQSKPTIAQSKLKVCAGKNPCASKKPCAGKNPCASKKPCAGKNPCASKKPCAGKNPCAGKTANAEVFMVNGVAVRGTDVVAYFTQGKAIPGSRNFAAQWKGATWYFSSAANRDLFASNPTQYAPQYGGYCAKAVSEGNLAPTDPEAWKIVNGKLYLNYDKTVQAEWLKDVPGNIAKADRNWPAVLATK